MKNLTKKITAFLTDEQGAETVEWVVVVALVVTVCAASFGALGTKLDTAVKAITTALG